MMENKAINKDLYLRNIMRLERSKVENEGTPEGYLTGKLLVSMPFLEDSRFSYSVIFVCGHDSQGAIGLVINKILPDLTFKDLLNQLNIDHMPSSSDLIVHYGGPIDLSRGFVLHSSDYHIDTTIEVGDCFSITSTLEILRALARGTGPEKYLICLGYTGWSAGQLEQELQNNGWLVVEPTEELVFDPYLETKWRSSLAALGVDPAVLSLESGHA